MYIELYTRWIHFLRFFLRYKQLSITSCASFPTTTHKRKENPIQINVVSGTFHETVKMFDHFFIFSSFPFFLYSNSLGTMLTRWIILCSMGAFIRFLWQHFSDTEPNLIYVPMVNILMGKLFIARKSRAAASEKRKKFMVLIFTGLTSPKPER